LDRSKLKLNFILLLVLNLRRMDD